MRFVRCCFVLLLVIVCAAAKSVGPEARAAAAPVTVTFTDVGAHAFTVPTGITSIHVVAVGAPGGNVGVVSGGAGAVAVADLAVSPGQVLTANVGGPGTGTTGAVSFGGGGGAGLGSGGGGGASDLRTGGAADLSTRLVVAGGGGGAGSQSAGGAAGQPGVTIQKRCEGGGAASASAGGTGGEAFDGGDEASLRPGKPGTSGQGGSGSANAYGGGGGGGGLFGGGGGGASGQETAGVNRCGGGGGSSGFGAGTSATSVSVSESRAASLTITYTPPSGSGGPTTPTNPTNPTNPGSGSGTVPSKATLSLPAVQHGNRVVGTVGIPANRSVLKANLFGRGTSGKGGSRRVAARLPILGRLTEAPLKKGLHSFTVKLNKRGKRSLAKLGKLKLTLEVRVTPPQGTALVGSKKVTLKP